MWFSENPWPGVIACGVLAVIFLILWSGNKRALYLILTLVSVVGAGGVYLLELSIVTESERVERKVYELTSTFQRGDIEGTLELVSKSEPILRTLVQTVGRRVKVGDDLRMSDLSVSLSANESLAATHFRANATVEVDPIGNVGFQPSRWQLRWRKEGGDWKVIEVTRLNPITGESINVFSNNH